MIRSGDRFCPDFRAIDKASIGSYDVTCKEIATFFKIESLIPKLGIALCMFVPVPLDSAIPKQLSTRKNLGMYSCPIALRPKLRSVNYEENSFIHSGTSDVAC